MKKGTLTTRLVIALLALAVLAYFGVQAWRYFVAPETATAVYAYRAERVLTLSGFVVRDEEVIACDEPLVELTRAEGERVGKGQRVATVYQSADALEAERTAADLRERLAQLQAARAVAGDAASALRLDGEIEADIITLRAAFARGSCAAADSAAASLETAVLRREYAYRGSAALDERIAALEAELAAASRAVGGGARAVTAPFAGAYSAVADGYEGVLTPAALADMTPAALRQLAPAPVRSTVGKLIRGDDWYYAAAIAESDAADLAAGQAFSLAVSGAARALPVTVESVGAAQDGECLLVLRGSGRIADVSMLREQSAELILASYEGLRVPKNALRVGEDGRLGVYCRIGRQAWCKPVVLLYRGEDYCLVAPGRIDAARESDLVFYTLRAGDEAIVSAKALYNGKVLE